MSTINVKFTSKSILPAFPSPNDPKSVPQQRKINKKMLGFVAYVSYIFGQFKRPTIKNELKIREQIAWMREMEDFDRF